MGKLIIKNKTEINDLIVIDIIKEVIMMGRISNNDKQFCYLTAVAINHEEYHVVTDLRKCSDVFTFYKCKEYKNENLNQ
jgi:hypothetical protein